MRSPDELVQRFRDAGLKITPQRRAIFEELEGNTAHPTAESVYQAVARRLPMLSRRTVYQTLNDLAAMGEVQHMAIDHGAGRFDPRVDAHHHAICSRCGLVADLEAHAVGVDPRAVAAPGFRVESAEVVLRGVCAACAASER